MGNIAFQLRPFAEHDYDRLAAIAAAVEPTRAWTPEILRHRDSTLEPRVRRRRLVAETEHAGVVGWGQVMHTWWAFHPRRYALQLQVDPDWQRRGIGSALFDTLLEDLQTWDPEVVRVEARATQPHVTRFLEHRGFVEWRRRWESVLDVASANSEPLLKPARRVVERGVTISTYAAEHARRGDRLAHEVYEAEALITRDEPGMEESAEPMSFERFFSFELQTPEMLPEGHFLALTNEAIVGISRLRRDLNHPDILHQAFTGTHPRYRGRGIAQALKLRTIAFAREHGYRQIRTANDSTNAPMLHINDVIGFKRESPRVIYERRF